MGVQQETPRITDTSRDLPLGARPWSAHGGPSWAILGPYRAPLGQNVVLSSTFGSGGSKMLYSRQFWARVAPKCCTVVNFWLGWPENDVLSQFGVRVAPKCCTVVNFWLGWPKNDVLSSVLGSGGPEMMYCRQLLARVAQKCALSSILGSGGPEMLHCRQLLARVAQKFWARVAPK